MRLFSVISRKLFEGGVLLCTDAVGVFDSPRRPMRVWYKFVNMILTFAILIIFEAYKAKQMLQSKKRA